MAQEAKQTLGAIASSRLDGQLADVLAAIRRRLRQRALLASSGIALTSGVGTFSFSAMGSDWGTGSLTSSAGMALLGAAISAATAAALYPALKQRESWLLRDVSIITHDNIDLLSVLGKLTELRNGETAGHNLRVTLYTLLFAEALGLPREEIVRTVKGALLHDVGKLAVPDRILGKPGRLTPDEFAEMTLHVRYGLEIISQSVVLREASAVVGAHHERYDGKGYPLGLAGEAIPHEARLFALVDVFDALTTVRVYKPAFRIDEALATMAEGRGSHFDSTLFDRFSSLVPEFARRLPEHESGLAAMLMDRLTPYLDMFVHVGALPISSEREAELGIAQDSREVLIHPAVSNPSKP